MGFAILMASCFFFLFGLGLKKGHVNIKGRYYSRDKDPRGFWLSVGIYLFFGIAFLSIAFSGKVS